MKLKIKVRRIPYRDSEGKEYVVDLPQILEKGDYIDLRVAVDVDIEGPKWIPVSKTSKEYKVVFTEVSPIPLGVAIKVPDGYYCRVVPRSSTPIKYGILLGNSEGIIDGGKEGYNGNNDEWKYLPLAFTDCHINKNERVCQFEVVLSQKATVWQRIKNLFYNGVEIVEVDDLESEDRGGIGTTGVN